MGLLGQAEREHAALVEDLRGAGLRRLVVALPDRAEAEDGDLPRVPVAEAVERQHLAEGADACGVPATALRPRREEGGEGLLRRHEVQEVGVPLALVVDALELRLAACLEPLDRRSQEASRLGVEVGGVVGPRVEQQVGHHGTLAVLTTDVGDGFGGRARDGRQLARHARKETVPAGIGVSASSQ